MVFGWTIGLFREQETEEADAGCFYGT